MVSADELRIALPDGGKTGSAVAERLRLSTHCHSDLVPFKGTGEQRRGATRVSLRASRLVDDGVGRPARPGATAPAVHAAHWPGSARRLVSEGPSRRLELAVRSTGVIALTRPALSR